MTAAAPVGQLPLCGSVRKEELLSEGGQKMKAPETSPDIDITESKQTEELRSTEVVAGMKGRMDAGTEEHGRMDAGTEEHGMKKRKTYRLQTQLSICFIILLILISAILTSILYLNFQDRIREDTRDRLRDEVAIAALQIDGDAHNNLTGPGDEGNSNYLQLRSTLQQIRDAGSDIYYIYTMRLDDNGSIMFLVDARMAVPFTLLALVAAAIFGSGPLIMILIIGFSGWAG